MDKRKKSNLVAAVAAGATFLLIIIVAAAVNNSGNEAASTGGTRTTQRATTTEAAAIRFAHDDSMSDKERKALHEKLLKPCYDFAKEYADDFLVGTELTPEFHNQLSKDISKLTSANDLFNQYSLSQIFVTGSPNLNADLTIARAFIMNHINPYYQQFASEPSKAWGYGYRGSVERELFIKPLLAMLDYYGFNMNGYYNFKDEPYAEAMERFQASLSAYR